MAASELWLSLNNVAAAHVDCGHRFFSAAVTRPAPGCRVKTGEVVTLPTPPPKRGKRQGKQQGAAGRHQSAAEQQQQQVQDAQQQQRQGQQQQGGQPGQAAEQQPSAAGGSVQPPAAPQQLAEQAPLGQLANGAAPSAALGSQTHARQQGGPGPSGGSSGSGEEGPLNPVCCAVCDTEVGLRDAQEGVYHFFNVFASNS